MSSSFLGRARLSLWWRPSQGSGQAMQQLANGRQGPWRPYGICLCNRAQEVMIVPPVGYTLDGLEPGTGDGYTNRRYAMCMASEASITRDYVLIVDTTALKNVTKLTARYVCPLKGRADDF